MTGLNDAPETGPGEGTEAGSLLAEISGGGDETEQRYSGERVGRFGFHKLIVALVFVASAAALYGMRQYGMGAGITFKDVKIDYQFDDKDEQGNDGTILTMLARSLAPIEMESEQLGKNPFYLFIERRTQQAPAYDDGSNEAARLEEERRKAEQERRRRIHSLLADLELNGILGGRSPMARLNGKTVRVGHIVDELLTVISIEGRAIRLRVVDGEEEFELPMGPNPYASVDAADDW